MFLHHDAVGASSTVANTTLITRVVDNRVDAKDVSYSSSLDADSRGIIVTTSTTSMTTTTASESGTSFQPSDSNFDSSADSSDLLQRINQLEDSSFNSAAVVVIGDRIKQLEDSSLNSMFVGDVPSELNVCSSSLLESVAEESIEQRLEQHRGLQAPRQPGESGAPIDSRLSV